MDGEPYAVKAHKGLTEKKKMWVQDKRRKKENKNRKGRWKFRAGT